MPATAANARGPLDVAGIVTLALGLLATMGLLTRLYASTATSNAALAWAMLVVGAVVVRGCSRSSNAARRSR